MADFLSKKGKKTRFFSFFVIFSLFLGLFDISLGKTEQKAPVGPPWDDPPPELWFPVGEEIDYEVFWGVFMVAEATAKAEWIERDGRRLLSLNMRAKTNGLVEKIYPVKEFLETIIEPISFPVSYTHLDWAYRQGRYQEAAELFRRLATDYPRAPTALEALKASALARVKTGDSSGALEDWDALLGKKTGVEKALRAEALLQKALVQIDLKKRSDALSTLDELLREDSEGAQAAAGHYWRGVLLADDEKWESAESALKLSLAHVPEEEIATLARLRLVVVLQRLDRMDEAADQIEPLLAQPARVAENPALVEWLIQRRFDQDQYTATVEAATALAEHGRGPAWRQIGWYWVGTAQTQLQDESAATAAYKKAVSEKAQTREGVESRLLLAALELKAGRYEQAEEGYTAAADMATGDDTQDLRVRAYFGLGEVAEAQGPVSYTHLDVYKRQVSRSARFAARGQVHRL